MHELGVFATGGAAKRWGNIALYFGVCTVVGIFSAWLTRAPIVQPLFPSAAIALGCIYVVLRAGSHRYFEARALDSFAVQAGLMTGYYSMFARLTGHFSALDVVLMTAVAVLSSAALGLTVSVGATSVWLATTVPALFFVEGWGRAGFGWPGILASLLWTGVAAVLTLWLLRRYPPRDVAIALVAWIVVHAFVVRPALGLVEALLS